MIVVEGPPGSGRHELVTKLARDLGVSRLPIGPQTREGTLTVLGYVVAGSASVKVREGFFFDKVLNGHRPQFSEGEVIYVRKILAALECPIIVCLPPWREVVKEANPRQAGEFQTGDLSDSQLEGLFLEYTNLILNSPGSTVVSHELGSQPIHPSKLLWYDHTGEQEWTIPYNFILERCRDYITKRTERTW